VQACAVRMKTEHVTDMRLDTHKDNFIYLTLLHPKISAPKMEADFLSKYS
jgi:hypothetical protein